VGALRSQGEASPRGLPTSIFAKMSAGGVCGEVEASVVAPPPVGGVQAFDAAYPPYTTRSAFAARMKSFSESPPIEWVERLTRTLPQVR